MPVLMGSVTQARLCHRDQVVVCGSHGGLYAAALASRVGMRGVILHDAGIGMGGAGVEGVLRLKVTGMGAAAARSDTCRIGDPEDMVRRGVIGTANAVAKRVGVEPGMSVAEAADLLERCDAPFGKLSLREECRHSAETCDGVRVLLADSASLVRKEDSGRVVITGSHGGMLLGQPDYGINAQARLAVFNDAGIGMDEAGVARLPILERNGVPGVTVSHYTARIGDAHSALNTGVISRTNKLAASMGLTVGARLSIAISTLP